MEDLRFHTNLLTPKSVLLSTLPSSKKLVFVCSICVHTNMMRGPMLGYISVGVLKNNPANKWLLVLKTKGKILTFFLVKVILVIKAFHCHLSSVQTLLQFSEKRKMYLTISALMEWCPITLYITKLPINWEKRRGKFNFWLLQKLWQLGCLAVKGYKIQIR